ncbi:MAG: hypothetical protein VR65_05415 [Desulfobulbaceae bacterium BRH_c16a]|nr:MAG: hypothetical protein VR65_05415 [Desulfobulbaceae bacterium BRH_c16a]
MILRENLFFSFPLLQIPTTLPIGAGARSLRFLPERKVRTLQGRVVRNTNAGRPGESATENKPPDSIR